MTGQEIAFLIVAIVGGIAAIRLVTSQNVIHAALYLVVTLTSVGAVYLLLAAEFIAWVQILIYVGAIVVLLLFSLMLTKAPIGRDTLDNQQRGVAAVIGIGILIGLVILLQATFGGKRIAPNPTHTAQVGASLFRGYVLPFEIVSVLLLAALVGAVVLARKEEAE
jgi:NADH-quinone oxidoreductase subunit J